MRLYVLVPRARACVCVSGFCVYLSVRASMYLRMGVYVDVGLKKAQMAKRTIDFIHKN